MDNLFCIDLDQPDLAGFRQFISAWLYRGPDFTLLVDPGPLSTIPRLLGELRRHRVERIEYVLLTHIHIDHAGGTAALLGEFPEARVVCHPEGMRHLAAPEQLWQGTRKVLGELADAYGEIRPVPKERLAFAEQIGATGVHAFVTPGHAPHHCCYLLGDLLFAGEVAGVRCELADGIYMRPATPPRFVPKVALASLDRMIALAPQRMVFAHHGLVDDATQHLRIARRQLLLWLRGAAETASGDAARHEERFCAWLMDHDKIFRNIRVLPPDIRARERRFVSNTLKGMSDYLAGLPAEARRALAEPIRFGEGVE